MTGDEYNKAWEMGRKQGLREAAAEIERLERHIKDLRELREFDRIEIERLRTNKVSIVVKAKDAEIERLRADNERLHRSLGVK